ncbi:MAG: hypothetical protein A2V70_01410 [Planctomycetes bacterium RBG_13_63_9]|nr:MAG: hypothetical protein A2V70_01410 [Planctomycetes bacterium RBG_13_63_9]
MAVSLLYEDGLLVHGVTRGNGRVGDDITHNIRTIGDVPLRLAGKDVPPVLEVRGEVYMRNSDLVRLNEAQQRKGEPPYANTRNVTAGSMRLLDPRICAERHLRLFCHGVGYVEGLRSETHMAFLDELRQYGLPATPEVECFDSFAAAVEHCEHLIERLHELDFEIDGLVLKVNGFDQRQRLGSTSKCPRWVIAYKFEKYEATTRLNQIRVQVGKTGAITPVADLEPVELAGTTVSRASLHNADEIQRKDVREGDVVVVEKAGKIIPHIVRVEKHQRQKRLRKFTFPTECPECGTDLVKDEGGVYIRCPNLQCPAQLKERIRYFASRNAMDIEGLGDVLVDELVDRKLVRTFADLYRLKTEQLTQLEFVYPWGREKAEGLIAAIEESKAYGLVWLLTALGISGVGEKTAKSLADAFPSMRALAEASDADMARVPGVSGRTARAVAEYLSSDFGQATICDLLAAGVKTSLPGREHDQGQPLPFPRPRGRGAKRRQDQGLQKSLFEAEEDEKVEARLTQFARAIKGLGETRAKQLLDEGLVRTYADFYRLKVEQIESLQRVVRVSEEETQRQLKIIQDSKDRGLARLLTALSIRHVGARVATLLAENFGSMDALMQASVQRLSEINEIGSIIAQSVHDFLHSKFGAETIRDLRKLGVKMEAAAPAAAGTRGLEGKTLVVTGTLSRYSRDEINELITRHGGRASSSVSSKTDYLVVGENPGSKLANAQKLGVKVISETEFDELLKA